MKNLIIISAILTGSLSVLAAPSEVDMCLDKANNNVAMKQCVFEEFARQDKKLNAEYKKLITGLKKNSSEDGKEILNRVVLNQRAWIPMRDTTCEVEAIDMLGGTGEGLIRGGCLGRLTKERVEQVIKLQESLIIN